ncbi:hypothetical protein T484DRAFT_1875221 [Baffinella frigidus]|nr:hypothetical protein T484DRAFT_1875221 [Cryptophyta sp. CCMP2293]
MTPKKVQAICEIERLLLSHPLYKLFCVLEDATSKCAKQGLSVSAQFYEDAFLDPETGSCPLLSHQQVDEWRALVGGFFASSGANASLPGIASKGDTNTTRSLLSLGGPLKGFKDGEDEQSEQAFLRRQLFTGIKCPVRDVPKYTGPSVCEGVADGEEIKGVETLLFERFKMEGVPSEGTFANMLRTPYRVKPIEKIQGEGDMGLVFYGRPTQQAELTCVVSGDLNFAILSIVVVHLYIWFHTKSVFIANMAMLSIIMSLPVGFFCYYNIFRVRFYSQINILAIYLALGIGADSVFVLVDSWNQAWVNPKIGTARGRLNYAMSRTIQACFNTTLTTVMSFIATSFTPVLPIYAFAAFASSVLAVGYIFMIVFAPTWIMLFHVHFSDQGGMCCYCSRSAGNRLKIFQANEHNSDSPDTKAIREIDKLYTCCPYSRGEATQAQRDAAFDHRQLTEQERLSKTDLFFHNRFAPIICGKEPGRAKPFAYFFIALFVAYGIFMIYSALQLTPPTAQEVWFPESHMFNKELFDRLSKNWQSGADADYLKLTLVFGVETYDRTGTGPSKMEPFLRLFTDLNRGEIIYDEAFDLSSEASQRFFMETCQQLGDVPCTAGACHHGKLMKKDTQVTCVIDAMLNYYNNFQLGNYTHPGTATVIPEAKFVPLYKRFFTEEQAASPLQNRQSVYSSTIALDAVEGRLKWARMEVRSSLIYPLGNADAHAAFDVIEDFTEARRADAPPGMQTLFQTDTLPSSVGWTWMNVEDALVRNLLFGFTLCFPVALVVLIFATGNIVIAVIAVSTIIFIVAGVLGAARVFYGWELGVAESIAGVIVIGFSVDYTVHLGHMYRDSPAKTREEKTRYALTYMGGTVVGGSLTTLLAGGVLYLCTLMFFTKMASLLVWTIVLSNLYSLFYFTSMCAVFGPQGDFGAVPSLAACLARLSRRK